jgi:hypothetical protein
MNSSSKPARGERFLSRVQQAGELTVTVMATSSCAAVSSAKSKQAAQQMVGGLHGSGERVNRLALKLDRLVNADRASESSRESAAG